MPGSNASGAEGLPRGSPPRGFDGPAAPCAVWIDTDGLMWNDGSLKEIEQRAVRLAREAGAIVLSGFGRPLQVAYKEKGRSNPVTDVDREVEAFLRSAISESFPEHSLLGEEGDEPVPDGGDALWVVDPLDGTINFLNGLPLFACSLALLSRGEPVVGAIYLPVVPAAACAGTQASGERLPVGPAGGAVLHARLGGGAFLDGVPVRVSDASEPEASSLSGLPGNHVRQFQRMDGLRRRPGEPRCLGSVCFEAALVAAGVFRYAVFGKPKLWDVAAASLIVREAGGVAMRWAGDRWVHLVRFDPMPNPRRRAEVAMRFWEASTLVAGSPVGGYVAERLRPRSPAGVRRPPLVEHPRAAEVQ